MSFTSPSQPGGSSAPRRNGDFFLMVGGAAASVFDDSASDRLTGGRGKDWFFANLSGGVALDIINGLGGSEIVEELGVLAP